MRTYSKYRTNRSYHNEYSGERKHTQIRLNKWTVWYKGEYRGTVKACDEYQALSYISTEKYPERKEIVLVRIVIED